MIGFPVADGHCDTACELLRRKESLAKNSCHISLEHAEKLPGYLQFFAFWTEEPPSGMTEAAWFHAMYDSFLQQLAQNQPRICLCRTGAEMACTLAQHKMAACLSMEGTGAIDADPGRLDALWEMGIRMITLTWNGANALAGSYITGEGLSARGKAFVRRAQQLGMVIDVSHLSERAFWDLCEITEAPVIASHSNARACCGHGRNLTDAQFREICAMGGTTGINLYSVFLNTKQAHLSDVARHLDHFLSLGGENHIALGGDLDGCDSLPESFSNVSDYTTLAAFLTNAGFPEPLLEKLYYKNLMRVVNTCNM